MGVALKMNTVLVTLSLLLSLGPPDKLCQTFTYSMNVWVGEGGWGGGRKGGLCMRDIAPGKKSLKAPR